MEVIGISVCIILTICTLVGILTNRYRWVSTLIWGYPLIGLGSNYVDDMEINGLLILMSFIMILITILSVYGVRLWNTKQWRKSKVIYPLLFIFSFLVLIYVYIEAMKLGYIYNFLDIWPEFAIIRNCVYILILILFAKITATSFFMVIERFFSKKEELRLIQCKFISSNKNIAQRFKYGYYLSGINNGELYYLKMTKRTFYLIKKESRFIFNVSKGFLGGIYISKNPCPQNSKYILKRDRETMTFFILATIISTIVVTYFYIKI